MTCPGHPTFHCSAPYSRRASQPVSGLAFSALREQLDSTGGSVGVQAPVGPGQTSSDSVPPLFSAVGFACRSVGSRRRGSGPMPQRGCRGGLGTTLSRLLRSSVRGSQVHRRVAACSRPLSSQPVSQTHSLQNGNPSFRPRLSKAGRLGYVHRSDGRVLSRHDPPLSQEVDAFRLETPDFSVPSFAFRALSQPLDFYEGGERIGNRGQGTWCPFLNVHRRLARQVPDQGRVRFPYSACSATGSIAGVLSQPGKIGVDSLA